MFVLKYSETDTQAEPIRERFRQMSLGYKQEHWQQSATVTLYDNEELLATGLEEINAYLDEVQRELKDWYYCKCDS